MRTFVPAFRARRFSDCIHYADCLDRAAKVNANALPCRTCPRYIRQADMAMDPGEMFGILSLIQTIFREDEELDGLFTDNEKKA